jgi:sporulation protein YlmC with PRC-barrel domain
MPEPRDPIAKLLKSQVVLYRTKFKLAIKLLECFQLKACNSKIIAIRKIGTKLLGFYAKELSTFVFLFFFVDVMLVGFDELLGKSVIGAKGNYIGDVCGGDIEHSTWKVTYLQVKPSKIAAKEIGVKKAFKKHTVRIPTSLIDKIGVVITLNR